jgi:PAS domain S-box-containing protein
VSKSGSRASCNLDDVLITAELRKRPSRAPDFEAEARVLNCLAEELAARPRTLLTRVAESVLEICRTESAGVSILEPGSGQGVFRWKAVAGKLAPVLSGTIPREGSPCGEVIARNAVLLFDRAYRHYPGLRGAGPAVGECLLAPWTAEGELTGTLWAIAHSRERRFDAEDARLLASLARFAAAAWRTVQALDAGTAERAELEHRVQERARAASDAGDALRRHAARQALLVRLQDTLRTLADPLDIQARACRLIGEHLGVNRCAYGEIHGDDVITRGVYLQGASPLPERFPYATIGEQLRDAYLRGDLVAVDDVHEDPRLSGAERAACRAAEIAAFTAVMLVKGGRRVATFGTHCATPRRWTEEELDLIRDAAERTCDAVERARAEASLRESEERLRVVIESLEDYAIFTVDPEGRVTSWSGGARRLKGYTADEVLGTPVARFYTAEDRAAGMPGREMARALSEGRSEVETWHVRKDGSRFWANEIVRPLWADDGTHLGFTKISRDLTERKRLEDALHRAQEGLEARVRERTSALARANASLETEVRERRAAEDQIKALIRRLMSAQEEERRRIARDIHDQLGQQVTALRMNLEALRARAAADAALSQLAERTQRLAEEIDQSVDSLTWELRPAALDHLGLAAALRNLVSGWSQRFGIPAEFDAVTAEGLRLKPEVEANMYRLAQEALHNVLKHAGATEVSVLLQRSHQHAVLVIEDDGRGFDPSEVPPDPESGRLGLVSMRERATLMGGTLEIEAAPGAGTSLFLRVPIGGP